MSLEPHLPARSFSDPTPLSITQREQNPDEIVADLERHYLGNWVG